MYKANKELQPLLESCLVFTEILDARCPAASSNPLRRQWHDLKPSIRILNKCDLAEETITRQWQAYFQSHNNSACLLSSPDQPLSREQLLVSAERLLADARLANNSYQQKLIVISGVPNVGKSSLLNSWIGRRLARTGNEPAITRSAQKAPLQDDWYLVDTPGLLWPKLEDQHAAYLLAALGAIRQTAIEAEDVAWYIAAQLLEYHPQLLEKRYELAGQPNSVEALFTAIAQGRGALRNGRAELHRVAEILLGDLRSGRLGRISLEQPPADENSA